MNEEKSIRKQERKIRRLQAILAKKKPDIHFSQEPTPHLLLYNVGASCGLDAASLLSLLSELTSSPIEQSVVDFVLVPNESYCFISFQDSISAEKAYSGLKNKTFHANEAAMVIYASHISEVPRDLPCLLKELQELFDPFRLPKGLEVIEDFVSETEEKEIVDQIDFTRAQELKSRRVIHFGYAFEYEDNSIDSNKPLEQPIPEEWHLWLERLRHLKPQFQPDQCTVNRYEAGSSIASHIDSHYCCTNIIASLSLLSDIVMEFRENSAGKRVNVRLPRRSLLIMEDEARYSYAHGIKALKYDFVLSPSGQVKVEPRNTRVSLTLRQALPKSQTSRAIADNPSSKDSNVVENKIRSDELQINDTTAKTLEQRHVHNVYECISTHFSETRHKPWPKVTEFLQSFNSSSVIIDVGCGNGKYLIQDDKDALQLRIGGDYSNSLASICRERNLLAVQCDCLALPFKSQSADGLVCIAVIHHLATKERRVRALREMGRVLKPSGRALVYVWAKEQRRHQQKSSYLKSKNLDLSTESVEKEIDLSVDDDSETKVTLPIHNNRTDFKHKDMLVPWKVRKGGESVDEQSETFMRFYHLSEEGELESLIESIEELRVLHSYYDQGNWCVIFERSIEK